MHCRAAIARPRWVTFSAPFGYGTGDPRIVPLLREHHTHARSYWKHGHVQSYVHQRDQHRYWMCFAKVVVAHSLQGALAIYPSYPLVTFCGGLRTSCHHGHRSTRLCGNGPSYSWAENQRISKNQQIFFEFFVQNFQNADFLHPASWATFSQIPEIQKNNI